MKRSILIAFLVICFFPTFASGGWLIYHKPAFEGQVRDAETKEPIEGAVVVALYEKASLRLVCGPSYQVIKIREALTGKDGKFRIPSYTTLIQPLSWTSHVRFIIYKPGYVNVELNLEDFFSGREIGVPDVELRWFYNQEVVYRFIAPNIVELSKVKTREERLKAVPGRSPKTREEAINLENVIKNERSLMFSTKGG